MKKNGTVLKLAPADSHCLVRIICITHILCLSALILSDLDLAIQIILAGVVCINLVRQWNFHVLRSNPDSPQVVYWDADGQWLIFPTSGSSYRPSHWDVLLHHPALIILRFHRENEGEVTLLLCGDSLSRETRRQLLIRLRIEQSVQPQV